MIKGVTPRKAVWAAMLAVSAPFVAGCTPAATAITSFGAFLWLDLALTPVRSFLGTLALNFVNSI